MLRLGVQHAGLKPREFWQLTPAELMLILGLDQDEKPLNRARMLELEEQFSRNQKDL